MNQIIINLQAGFSALNQGRFLDAIKHANLALDFDSKNIDAMALLGISNFKIKNFDASLINLQEVRKIKFDWAIESFYLESLLKTSQFEEVINSYKNYQSNPPENIIRIAITSFEMLGDFKKAFDEALNLQKDLHKNEILAWNAERLNQLEHAKKYAKDDLITNRFSFKSNVVCAKIYLRKGKYQKALSHLKQIKKESLTDTNISIYFSIKAQIREKQHKFKKAFKLYTKSNNALKKTKAYKNLKGNSFYSSEKLSLIKRFFANNELTNLDSEDHHNTVFMVGFPRSGTTLLENVLNAHSKIKTIEEKPTVDGILSRFLSEDRLKDINSISQNEIQELQQEYLNRRNSFIEGKLTSVVIDKLPLNIIHVGILHTIFPKAKFIVSKRDIRDVALSCYFQNFAINDAMSYFLDWEQTKKYLKQTMEIGMNILQKYSIPHYIVEYESFVQEPEITIKEVLEFLDLKWEDEILNYRENLKGKNINTPSYAKVSEKINTNQISKWERYSKFVEFDDL